MRVGKKMRGVKAQSKPSKTMLKVAAGVLLGIGVFNGASIWGALYYVAIGLTPFILFHFYKLELKTAQGKRLKKDGGGGIIKIILNALRRIDVTIGKFIGPFTMESRRVNGQELYQKGLFRFTIIMMVIAHLYAILVVVLDKFSPVYAGVWYQITSPFIDFQMNYSYGYEKVRNSLLDYGYIDRIDFISHLYAAPIYISFLFISLNAVNTVKMFNIEVKAHIFYIIYLHGKKEVLGSVWRYLFKYAILQTIFVVPMFLVLDYWMFLGAPPLDIFTFPKNLMFLLSAYDHRGEMFVFAILMPITVMFNLFVIKMVIAHCVISARLVRRQLRTSLSRN